MTPFELAQQVYHREPCARDFWTDLLLHLHHGYVFSTRDTFLMGRAVDRYASYEEITSPTHVFESPNAWLVYLAASARKGEAIRTFLRYEPHELPWIGWERKNRLRWYPRAVIIGKLHGQ